MRHRSPDREVARLAAAQHGVFSRRQALAAGVTRRMVEQRLEAGRWERSHESVYRLAGAPTTWKQAVMAACLAAQGAACRCTAGVLHGLSVPRPKQIEVAVERRRRPRTRGVVVHRPVALSDADVTTLDGIPVTTVARTIVDLSAVLRREALEIALDDAIRRTLVSPAVLRKRMDGRRSLRELLAQRMDGQPPADSALETAFLRALRRTGLPEPERQWPIRRGDRIVATVDFAYPARRLVIEVDGYRYHSGRRDWQHDLARQNEIVACGYDVLRFSSQDVLERADESCARVAVLLARDV